MYHIQVGNRRVMENVQHISASDVLYSTIYAWKAMTCSTRNICVASLDESGWSVDSGESFLDGPRSIYSPIPRSNSHVLHLGLS
ncbi:hypothetical protein B296_00051556 [Ensete ventricosum]|uniref:Uncharacterized protein n=1 Tax=Ensete ventricosum TaxID=4639 RepID=A0A426WZC9_ENSVE|nr:hypothetical protein B296_00051556 [Ensete ventricosum]